MERGLLRGATVLLISNIFVKGLGFLYRVLLVRLLGTEGVGLIELVNPLYALLLVLAGWGVQTALTAQIARDKSRSQELFVAGLTFLCMQGLLAALLGYLFSDRLLALAVTDQRALIVFRALLPAVPIIDAASAWRGLLQAHSRMPAIALAQNIEQVTRFLVGLLLLSAWISRPLPQAAAAASWASVAGEAAGFLTLLCFWYQERPAAFTVRRERSRPRGAALAALLRYGTPLTGTRIVITVIAMAQAFLVPYCLQKNGLDPSGATAAYGELVGVALALLHLPGVFTSALSVTVLPLVAESSGEQRRRRVTQAIHAVLTGTLPGLVLLLVFAEPYCSLIFASGSTAPLLRILAAGGVFYYLQITLSSVIQGFGAVRLLLLNSICSGLALLAGVYLLTPLWGVNGTAIAFIFSWLVGCLFNVAILRRCQCRLPWRELLTRPVVALTAATAIWFCCAAWLPSENKIVGTAMGSLLIPTLYFLILYHNSGLKLRQRDRAAR